MWQLLLSVAAEQRSNAAEHATSATDVDGKGACVRAKAEIVCEAGKQIQPSKSVGSRSSMTSADPSRGQRPRELSDDFPTLRLSRAREGNGQSHLRSFGSRPHLNLVRLPIPPRSREAARP
jgi:hypothetical protein